MLSVFVLVFIVEVLPGTIALAVAVSIPASLTWVFTFAVRNNVRIIRGVKWLMKE
jgi:hypothetical protein